MFSGFGEVGEVLYPSLCIDPLVVLGYFGYSDWALHCVKDICHIEGISYLGVGGREE